MFVLYSWHMHTLNPRTFVTANELQHRTGLPSRWLRREAVEGRLPCIRTRRALLFPVDAALRALEQRALQAMEGGRDAQ